MLPVVSAATLQLPDALRQRIAAAGQAAYPREACGLLVGRAGASPSVVEVTEGRNLVADVATDRYELDPVHLMEVERSARAQGLDVLGVWHSHPDHDAVPGRRDREGAFDAWSYVIVTITGGEVGDMRSWRLEGDVFAEQRLLP